MSKVIVEKSRRGGKYTRKGRSLSFDDLPKKESIRMPYGHNRKSLNENLNPLRRYLEANVGKKWDKVFSDICKNIKLDSAVQKHVRDHVFDYVHVNVEIGEKGQVLGQRRYGGTIRELFDKDMYVHPETGILKVYRAKNKYTYKPNPFEKNLAIFLERQECKFLLENKVPFKMYFDKLTDDFTIKQKATEVHAKMDFDSMKFRDNVRHLFKLLTDNFKKIDDKHIYFKTLLTLCSDYLEKKLKEQDKKRKKFPYEEGEIIEFSTDGGKTFKVGIINRIQDFGRHEKPTYWVTCGTKNVMVSGFVTAYIIRYPKPADPNKG